MAHNPTPGDSQSDHTSKACPSSKAGCREPSSISDLITVITYDILVTVAGGLILLLMMTRL